MGSHERSTRASNDTVKDFQGEPPVKERILVVNDHFISRVSIFSPPHAREALHLLRFKCDGILLDLVMPGMNDLTMFRLFKLERIHTPVIRISTPENKEELEHVIKAGATGLAWLKF
jgi:DNA-binding NarL/FixJ family response regulator